LETIPGDEISMLRILHRQRRLSLPKASDLTGFESERCRIALEGLRGREFVSFDSNEYWITEAGTGYLAFAKGIRNR
jgi:hypothetical protein